MSNTNFEDTKAVRLAKMAKGVPDPMEDVNELHAVADSSLKRWVRTRLLQKAIIFTIIWRQSVSTRQPGGRRNENGSTGASYMAGL